MPDRGQASERGVRALQRSAPAPREHAGAIRKGWTEHERRCAGPHDPQGWTEHERQRVVPHDPQGWTEHERQRIVPHDLPGAAW